MQKPLKFFGYVLVFIGVLVLVFVPRLSEENEGDQLFYISGHGEVLSEHPKERDTLTHSITLENPGTQSYTIKSVEPIISEDIKPLLIGKEPLVIMKTKKLKGKKKIEYKGEVNVRTIQLDEASVKKLIPAIKEYKITYDDGKEVTLKSGLR